MQNSETKIPSGTKVILFDGVCNLCNSAINYIIERDSKRVFRYASLQSELAQELAAERQIDLSTVDSIILIDPEFAYYFKSTAALEIARELKGPISWLPIFKFLPEALRDLIYDFIARNRYRWFGKRETCSVPSKDIQSLFLS